MIGMINGGYNLTWWALALVSLGFVDACSTIVARSGLAFININLATLTSETSGAITTGTVSYK